jgi:hypothetical protein
VPTRGVDEMSSPLVILRTRLYRHSASLINSARMRKINVYLYYL